jgi:hypothetical protein
VNRKILAGLAGVLALAGCMTGSQNQQAVKANRQVEAQASAFESFMRNARGIDASFSGPAEVSKALQVGAAYDPKQLEAGMVAYAAVAALQEPKFVAGIRKAGQARGGQGLSQRLMADPRLAQGLPGGDLAAARASAALYRQGDALRAGGLKVKQASYDVQKQAWSKVFVANAKARLSGVKAISGAGYRPAGGDRAKLYEAVAQGGRRVGQASPIVSRGLALAALTVLGDDAKARSLMSEPKTGMCVRIAKLNLYQCLASAGPYYEDIYCLAEHAMIEPGHCVVEAAKPPVSRRAQAVESGPAAS